MIEAIVIVVCVTSMVLSIQGGIELREAGVPSFSALDVLGFAVFLGSMLMIAIVLFSLVVP